MNVRIIFTGILFASYLTTHVHPETVDSTQEIMHKAVINDSPEEIKKAIQSVITHGNDEKSPMMILLKAIVNNSTEEVRQRLHTAINQGKDDKAPLVWSVLLSKSNAIEFLLECGAIVDTPIVQFAVKMGDVKAALLIAKSGVDLSSFSDDYLNLGVWNVSKDNASNADICLALELIQELITRGYDANKVWQQLLYHTPATTQIIDLLIKNGANPNHLFKGNKQDSWTPLLKAVLNNIAWGKEHTIVIEALLNAGADMNQQVDPFSWSSSEPYLHGPHSPLYYAINRGKTKAVALLLEHGASL